MSFVIVGYEHGRCAYFHRALIISFSAACSFVSRTYSHYCNLVLTPFVRDVFYVRLHLLVTSCAPWPRWTSPRASLAIFHASLQRARPIPFASRAAPAPEHARVWQASFVSLAWSVRIDLAQSFQLTGQGNGGTLPYCFSSARCRGDAWAMEHEHRARLALAFCSWRCLDSEPSWSVFELRKSSPLTLQPCSDPEEEGYPCRGSTPRSKRSQAATLGGGNYAVHGAYAAVAVQRHAQIEGKCTAYWFLQYIRPSGVKKLKKMC